MQRLDREGDKRTEGHEDGGGEGIHLAGGIEDAGAGATSGRSPRNRSCEDFAFESSRRLAIRIRSFIEVEIIEAKIVDRVEVLISIVIEVLPGPGEGKPAFAPSIFPAR